MSRAARQLPAYRHVVRSFGTRAAARAVGYLDRVRDVERIGDWVHATVIGGQPYSVDLFTGEEPNYYSTCTCPVADDCKHGAALALYLDRNGDVSCEVTEWIDLVARQAAPSPPARSDQAVLYLLHPREEDGVVELELRKGRPKKRGGWDFGGVLRHSPDWAGWDDLSRIVRANKLGKTDYWDDRPRVTSFDSEFIADLVATGRLIWGPTRATLRQGAARRLTPAWRWQKDDGGYRLGLAGAVEIVVAEKLHYVDLDTNELGRLELGNRIPAWSIIRAPLITEAAFHAIRAGLDRVAGQPVAVIDGPATPEPVVLPPFEPRLALRVERNGHYIEMTADYSARYGDRSVELGELGSAGAAGRDLIAEAIARNRAQKLLDVLDERRCSKATMTEHLGERVVPMLRAEGWAVEVTGDIEIDPPLAPSEWSEHLEFEESEGGDWFFYSIGVEIEGRRIGLLPVLLRALRDKRLDIGAVARGECEGLTLEVGRDARVYIAGDRLARWVRPLIELSLRGIEGDKLRLPAPVIADFAGELPARFAELPELARVRARLADLVDLEPRPEPPGFRGELRDYQRRGLAWLRFLHDSGYGGLLADDMGLGKTIQLLAFLEELRAEGALDAPALVVAPLSVVHNWRREAARFAPELEVLVHHGPRRPRDVEALRRPQLVITSYQTLARDAERFRAIRWRCLIADEAQAIKNARTKLWRAVAELEATSRFCVTGTPVENRLMELWSQIQIAMPGLLGTAERFSQMSRRIERGVESFEPVRRRLRPFLLRRSKAEVDIDLPPKTEIVERVELGTKQSDLYESLRLILEKKVRDALAARGVEGSALVILDALLRLRQSCCDPRLVKSKAARAITESAKLARLLEMLDELVAAGRSALVFSQFASMLELIERACEERGITTLKLTGKTRDRDSLIARFQAGEAPVFLISLKAGGAGINLTRADTVIHYDPWWNPAVEAQATDRAHRIGQDKPVFVYKLIAAATVEEKVLALQESKLALSDLALERSGLGHFGAEDIATLFQAL